MPVPLLYRLSAISGLFSAVLVLVNTARRTELLPANLFTRGIAPLAECFGLLALGGLYLVQRRESGVLGLVGYALNATGLVGTAGLDLAINWVFPYLEKSTVDELLAGPTGTLLKLASVLFLGGVVVFAVATWRARVLPAPAMGVYVLGLIPVALRAQVPAPIVNVGLVLTAVAAAWLAGALWTSARADSRLSEQPAMR
jgi:hypothetical protein